MKISQLTDGIHAVRIGNLRFNLSVRSAHNLVGVAAFKPGQKVPSNRKHLLLLDSVRNWIEEMEPQ